VKLNPNQTNTLKRCKEEETGLGISRSDLPRSRMNVATGKEGGSLCLNRALVRERGQELKVGF